MKIEKIARCLDIIPWIQMRNILHMSDKRHKVKQIQFNTSDYTISE